MGEEVKPCVSPRTCDARCQGKADVFRIILKDLPCLRFTYNEYARLKIMIKMEKTMIN